MSTSHPLNEIYVSGREYLTVATALLQRIRLADPTQGQWEAADLQWWWRKPRASDQLPQLFWMDDRGPVAGIILTDWRSRWGCSIEAIPGSISAMELWTRATDVFTRMGLPSVEVLVRDDNDELVKLMSQSGCMPVPGSRGGISWMRAEDLPSNRPLPDGFALTNRQDCTGTVHPMAKRNGSEIEQRLHQCTLYDPALDLSIETDTEAVAGYGLFWFDPVTRVGLVEPMRVEDAFQRRGLARALLSAGLHGLAERGATRFKVLFGTEAARNLYVSAGFTIIAEDQAYLWSAPKDR